MVSALRNGGEASSSLLARVFAFGHLLKACSHGWQILDRAQRWQRDFPLIGSPAIASASDMALERRRGRPVATPTPKWYAVGRCSADNLQRNTRLHWCHLPVCASCFLHWIEIYPSVRHATQTLRHPWSCKHTNTGSMQSHSMLSCHADPAAPTTTRERANLQRWLPVSRWSDKLV